MAKSPAWQRKEGKKPEGRPECKGPRFGKARGHEPQAACAKPED
jgi:hypothetical protein